MTLPTGRWPDEHGYLVLGRTMRTVKALGVTFGQNAGLWMGKDAVPKLVLCKAKKKRSQEAALGSDRAGGGFQHGFSPNSSFTRQMAVGRTSPILKKRPRWVRCSE
jgi:hypothetical protein